MSQFLPLYCKNNILRSYGIDFLFSRLNFCHISEKHTSQHPIQDKVKKQTYYWLSENVYKSSLVCLLHGMERGEVEGWGSEAGLGGGGLEEGGGWRDRVSGVL